MTVVMATSRWKTNASLIADCARLGYLRDEWLTLDPTYGKGVFWKQWRPANLVTDPVDFRALPFEDRHFDAVVFDPPYKLNGTPSAPDERYGVDVPASWQERMALCRDGIRECARVLGDGYLLMKCQDQVCSGKIRWQTLDFVETARQCGLGLVDRFDFLSYRAQDPKRRQVHARRNSSQLLVFKRGWEWRPA